VRTCSARPPATSIKPCAATLSSDGLLLGWGLRRTELVRLQGGSPAARRALGESGGGGLAVPLGVIAQLCFALRLDPAPQPPPLHGTSSLKTNTERTSRLPVRLPPFRLILRLRICFSLVLMPDDPEISSSAAPVLTAQSEIRTAAFHVRFESVFQPTAPTRHRR
jgi:hypothetical protein